jgi:hypothetical protein
MQLLKEGQSQWEVVRTRGLDQRDGLGKRATASASDALREPA